MFRIAVPGEVDGMAGSLARSRFSDRLTSRRGAWIALGVAVLVMVLLFGVFGGAHAPARTGQAPVGSESMQVSLSLIHI